RRPCGVLVALALALGWVGNASLLPATGLAQLSTIQQKQRTEKKSFTDAQIIEGFLKTSFGAEFQLAGRVDRIRKYVKPVRVFADNKGRPDRSKLLADIVADIGRHIQHIDIAMTVDR